MNFDLTTISNQMPDFTSHEEARKWFKDQFQDRFSLRTSDVVNGQKVYYYHLIKDPETYQHYMDSFAKPIKHEITNISTFESYSTIEISENGDITFTI